MDYYINKPKMPQYVVGPGVLAPTLLPSSQQSQTSISKPIGSKLKFLHTQLL